MIDFEKALFVAGYLGVLVLATGLFSRVSGGLRRASILSAFYWFYLLLSYLGTGILFFRLDPVYVYYGATDRRLLWMVWINSAACFLIVPTAAWVVGLVERRRGVVASVREDSASEVSSRKEGREGAPITVSRRGFQRWVLLGTAVLSVIPLVLYVRQLGQIPILLLLLSPEASALKLARFESTTGFAGKFHWYSLFFAHILPFLSYIAFFDYLEHRRKLFFPLAVICLFGCVMTLQKSPLAFYLASLGFAYLLHRNRPLSFRGLACLGGMLLAALLAMTFWFGGLGLQGRSVGSLLYGPFGRLLAGQLTALYFYYAMFPAHHSFLWGASFPNPRGLLPYTPVPLAQEVMKFMRPEAAAAGVIGTAPAVFYGEMYANFGHLGALASMVFVGVVLGFLHHRLGRDSYVQLALTVWFAFFLSTLCLTGLSGFIINLNLVGVLLVAWGLSAVSRTALYAAGTERREGASG